MKEEMAQALAGQPGQSFTRKQAVEWFKSHYELIKASAVQAHLIRLSTNTPVRLNYNPKPNEDDVFFKLDASHFRLYDPTHDPTPIMSKEQVEIDEETDDEETDNEGAAKFAYETDLRNYLAKNLSIIEPGLKLYQDDDGITGIEFDVGGRRIDILAVDVKGALVVIELKVSRGYDRVIGQLMRYMAWIKKNQAEPGQQVRGAIVAREISEDLLLACSLLAGVQLFEYELSLKLKSVSTASST